MYETLEIDQRSATALFDYDHHGAASSASRSCSAGRKDDYLTFKSESE